MIQEHRIQKGKLLILNIYKKMEELTESLLITQEKIMVMK